MKLVGNSNVLQLIPFKKGSKLETIENRFLKNCPWCSVWVIAASHERAKGEKSNLYLIGNWLLATVRALELVFKEQMAT